MSIKRLLEIDNNAVAITIDTDEATCIQRAIDTNQNDLIPAIKRVGRNLKKIEETGGLQVFMNQILEEINEYANAII